MNTTENCGSVVHTGGENRGGGKFFSTALWYTPQPSFVQIVDVQTFSEVG